MTGRTTAWWMAIAILAISGPARAADEPTLLRRSIFTTDFGAASDADYDNWPDQWQRRFGPGLPQHVRIKILTHDEAFAAKPAVKKKPGSTERDDSPRGKSNPASPNRPEPRNESSVSTRNAIGTLSENPQELSQPEKPVLAIKFDGGGAAVATPMIEVWPHFSYELMVDMKTTGVVRNGITIGIDFYDAERQLVRSQRSPLQHGMNQWTCLRLNNVTTGDPRVKYAAIVCEVSEATVPDLRGVVALGRVELFELPQLEVSLSRKGGLFHAGDTIEAICDLSSFRETGARLRFELVDQDERVVAQHEESLAKDAATSEPALTESPNENSLDEKKGVSRRFRWTHSAIEPGYYRITTKLLMGESTLIHKSATLAVMGDLPRAATGEFGWSLAPGDHRRKDIDWATMLTQAGVHWLKVPAWLDAGDEKDLNDLAIMSERISLDGISIVGVLDTPPEAARVGFGEANLHSAAAMFMHPDVWRPTVEPLMMRLGLRIRSWQLGADDDYGYVGFSQARDKVREFREKLARYGSDLRVGMPWRFEREAQLAETPWKFLSFNSDLALTAEELDHFLAAEAESDAQRWITLAPLDEHEYRDNDRVRDLVLRMLVARRRDAKAIFATRPISNDTGLLTEEGSPTELFLPWRTTASLIGGAQYIGSVRLPNESKNMIFRRGKHCVMAVWNDRPPDASLEPADDESESPERPESPAEAPRKKIREHIWLGESVRKFDLYGRSTAVETKKVDGLDEHCFEVGPEPIFLVGLHPDVMAFNCQLSLDNPKLASAFGRSQSLPFTVRSDFAEAITGRIVWKSERVGIKNVATSFRLAANEQRRGSVDFQLPQNANTGQQDLFADVELRGEKLYRFRVYRKVFVGIDDVEVAIDTSLDNEGNLVVMVKASNQSPRPIDFTCSLFVEKRRRERRPITQLGADRVSVVFVLPNGRELLNTELALKLEENGGGNRVINHTVIAHP